MLGRSPAGKNEDKSRDVDDAIQSRLRSTQTTQTNKRRSHELACAVGMRALTYVRQIKGQTHAIRKYGCAGYGSVASSSQCVISGGDAAHEAPTRWIGLQSGSQSENGPSGVHDGAPTPAHAAPSSRHASSASVAFENPPEI